MEVFDSFVQKAKLFRTFEEKGMLVHHTFSSGGFIKIFVQDSR
jgi:hypothetical protein